MNGYLAKRLLGAIPTLVGVSFLTFLFIRLIPGDAIKQGRATTDVAKRKDLYTTAQKELVNGVPFIWLFVGRDYVATLPTTKGFTHLPTGSIIYLRQTWLNK